MSSNDAMNLPVPEQPRNPYEPMGIGAMATDNGHRPIPPSTGLDGASLDSLLQARWQQGRQYGHDEGYEAASARWARIWEDGSVAGAAFASQLERYRVAVAAPQIIDGVRRRLDDIRSGTRSDDVKQLASGCLEGLQALIAVLGESGD